MLRLRFDELQVRAPQVGGAVGDGNLVDRSHRRGGRDRVGAGAFTDPSLDVGDGLRAVDDGGNAWKFGSRLIRHDGRFTQCTQLAGQRASVQMLEQGSANPAGGGLTRGGLTRRLSDNEAMAREVIAESLSGGAVLTDDKQSAHG